MSDNCLFVSVSQIKPYLPREIWRIIFDFMAIRDKLSSSKVIVEFREFYADLLSNFEEYFKNLSNHEVERVSRLGLKTQPADSIDALQIPCISLSINLSKHSVTWLDENKSSHRYLTFESDDSNIDNSTYLRVNHVCWLNFSIKNVILPTGEYNVFYKVKGPCRVENEYKVTIKHSVDVKNNIGYINQRQLKLLTEEWDWVPVYKDILFKDLLTVPVNFQINDELEVDLFNEHPAWTSSISFHVIRFALAR